MFFPEPVDYDEQQFGVFNPSTLKQYKQISTFLNSDNARFNRHSFKKEVLAQRFRWALPREVLEVEDSQPE
jgi:hypothetical protein